MRETEENNIRDMVNEVESTDIQDATDSSFEVKLSDNVEDSLFRYISENINGILITTYLELSKEYPGLQEFVDRSFLKALRMYACDPRKLSMQILGRDYKY